MTTQMHESKVIHSIQVDDMIMTVKYVTNHTFLVEVTLEKDELKVTLARSIPATYTPVFGIDVADLFEIEKVAEEMAIEIEENYEFIIEDEDEG